jgi:phosphoribosylformylglycinamidine synthase subunit PurSL
MAYGTPFISGKDSLNNEFQTQSGETIAIPATLLISAVSVIDDVSRCVTADAKSPGNYVFIVGATGPELGGSHYLRAEGLPTGNDVPLVSPTASRKQMAAVQQAIAAGLVRSCHDLSEGGLAVAAAEMAFAGGVGMELNLSAMPIGRTGFGAPQSVPATAMLFAESPGRFLVEVAPKDFDAFCRAMKNVPFGEIGRVTETPRLVIRGLNRKPLVDGDLAELKAAWQGTFRW